jgi:hypothetical protein
MSITARRSASISVPGSAASRATSIRPTRNGSVEARSTRRKRSIPWTIRRTVPSAPRASWWITATVPTV